MFFHSTSDLSVSKQTMLKLDCLIFHHVFLNKGKAQNSSMLSPFAFYYHGKALMAWLSIGVQIALL
jgi:hypothetical protein